MSYRRPDADAKDCRQNQDEAHNANSPRPVL
jgi:hypothetical protein